VSVAKIFNVLHIATNTSLTLITAGVALAILK